jgi:hypothetical protein
MPIRRTLSREVKVAFSKKAQPVWFRVLKWAIILTLTALFWRSPIFWWCFLAASILAVCLHLLWRSKTKRWTQPWRGWNDIDAGR